SKQAELPAVGGPPRVLQVDIDDSTVQQLQRLRRRLAHPIGVPHVPHGSDAGVRCKFERFPYRPGAGELVVGFDSDLDAALRRVPAELRKHVTNCLDAALEVQLRWVASREETYHRYLEFGGQVDPLMAVLQRSLPDRRLARSQAGGGREHRHGQLVWRE